MIRGLLILLCFGGDRPAGAAAESTLELHFRPVFAGKPLQLHKPTPLANGGEAAWSRVDFLVSGLELRSAAGNWRTISNGYGFISLGKHRLKTEAVSIPPGAYSALRFKLGVSAAENAASAGTFAAGHPLNPALNKLHWNWQDGYVFLALEGYVGRTNGFSYHLGNNTNLMTVELPVSFRAAKKIAAVVEFDLAKVLTGITQADLEKQPSTHSRPGDALAGRLKSNAEKAFRCQRVVRLAEPETPLPAESKVPPGLPFPISIPQRFPQASFPGDNPLTRSGVELGRRLFHEKRLSRDGAIACASCHQAGSAFVDRGKRFSLGIGRQAGTRNSMPLFNLAWHDGFFWDGRAKSLREQALIPIENPAEMGNTLPQVLTTLAGDREYLARFAKVFGSPQITPARIGLALEQFLLSLISHDSKFDRAVRGELELSAEEKRGLQLFISERNPALDQYGADCFHCHGGTLLSNFEFLNNGLDEVFVDAGRFAVTGEPADRGKFKVPSLRNVAVTAPYMHDGRFTTLREVIEHYDSGVKPSPSLDPNLLKHLPGGLELTEADKRALEAFLRTLTDESFLRAEAP